MTLMLQNFLLFQIGWFSCVLGGASNDYYLSGVIVVAAVIVIHLARASNIQHEIALIGITAIIGTVWDSSLTLAGLFVFANGVFYSGMVPLWIIAMWALFATTLNVSMKWMKNKYLLASLFGAIGGPVAYYAGYRFGAVEFSNTLIALVAVGIGWAIIMPLLMVLTKRFNGYRSKRINSYGVNSV